MKADVYWRYNLPVGYYRNTPEDISEGCGASNLRTSTPSEASAVVVPELVSYMPRKEIDYVDHEQWDGIEDQDREQFFLTASNVHYALAEQFYQLSQGEIQSVPSEPGNYLPEVTIVTADNVAEERERIRSRIKAQFLNLAD